MKWSWLQQGVYWILRYIQLQLFITLISLPILIAWGLPLTFLSLVGNLVGAPILALFLVLSTAIFICGCIGVSPFPLIWVLERVVHYWLTALSVVDNRWMMGFKKPPHSLLFAMVIMPLLIIGYKPLRSLGYTILALLVAIGAILVSLYFFGAYSYGIEVLAQDSRQLTIVYENNITLVIDEGKGVGMRDYKGWVDYRLLPFIIQHTGHISIDSYVIVSPSVQSFLSASYAIKQGLVKKLYIVNWKGSLSSAMSKAYGTLRTILKEKCILCVYCRSRQTYELMKSSRSTITLCVQEEQKRKGAVIYPMTIIKGNVGHYKMPLEKKIHNEV